MCTRSPFRRTPPISAASGRAKASINPAISCGAATGRSIPPKCDRSAVRVTLDSGVEGWGETYGLVAPNALHALIDDIIRPIITGRSPFDVQVIWEDLYDLMRVRGYHGGFWLDAMAAVDIALWDLMGQLTGVPLHKLLGGKRRDRIPAYVSGLPSPTLAGRVDLARSFVDKGYKAIKIAGRHEL